MSTIMHDEHSFKNHLLFNNLWESFPHMRDFLTNATNQDFVQGADYHTLIADPVSGFDTYFVLNLLKKVENLDIGVDPEQVAIDEFNDFLLKQEDTARFVDTILANTKARSHLGLTLAWVRRFFAKVFSDFDEGDVVPRFSSGATLTLPRGSSPLLRVKASEGQAYLLSQKLNYNPSKPITGHALTSAAHWLPHTTGTRDFFVRILVVPKNAKIGRVVGTHPSSVMALQNGLGDMFQRKALKFCGIDIPTASDEHRHQAMINSLDGDFATQDQRHASDNILRTVVESVFPPKVFNFMKAITPSTIKLDGELRHVHMMCPAGNGYIFPLQTMFFWALVKGVQHVMKVNHRVWVYGDDVILHKDVCKNVELVYKALGLQVNTDKSFYSGPFRESCGGDYLYGSNIRPFYAKCIPGTTIDWVRFANGIRRVGYYNNASIWRSNDIRNFWLRCVKSIPRQDRLFCPRHYGDAGINTEHSSAYRFAEPNDRDAAGIRYPGRTDKDGNPYCQERIYLYVPYAAGDARTFVDESRGIGADNLLRLLALPTISGSGGSLRTFKVRDPRTHKVISSELRWVYPKFFGREFEGYRIQKIPYSLKGQAPTETDALFEFLLNNGTGGIIHDTEAVVRKHNEKLSRVRDQLVTALKALANNRKSIEDSALNYSKEIDFSF